MPGMTWPVFWLMRFRVSRNVHNLFAFGGGLFSFLVVQNPPFLKIVSVSIGPFRWSLTCSKPLGLDGVSHPARSLTSTILKSSRKSRRIWVKPWQASTAMASLPASRIAREATLPAAKKPRMESGDTKGLAGTAFWGRWPGALKKSGKTPLMKIKPSKNTSHLRCNLQYIGSRLFRS